MPTGVSQNTQAPDIAYRRQTVLIVRRDASDICLQTHGRRQTLPLPAEGDETDGFTEIPQHSGRREAVSRWKFERSYRRSTGKAEVRTNGLVVTEQMILRAF